MSRVLVIDDNPALRESVGLCLEERGFLVSGADTAEEGLRLACGTRPELILLDIRLPDGSGLSVLEELRRRSLRIPVVVMTGFPTADTVLEALRMGASDYLRKPIPPESLLRVADRHARPMPEKGGKAPEDEEGALEDALVGGSPVMVEVFKSIGRAAPAGVPILIQGETGTGKEPVARAIHRYSGRSGPFVAMNCSAVVETLAESELFGHERGAFTGAIDRRRGRFEQAAGGTLFLDEIGDAPSSIQAKLLRALDRGEFERVGGHETLRPRARIVAATNRDLPVMVEEGTFRADLYYRLGVVTVRLPPLRERREDIPLLAEHLLRRLAGRMAHGVEELSREALQRLMEQDWPGNVRELESVLTRACLNAGRGRIEPEHLPSPGEVGREVDGGAAPRTLSEVEELHIAKTLQVAQGNRGRACDLLGITRPTLRRKMREYGLDPRIANAG